MSRSVLDYLEDILISMQHAQRFIEGMDYSGFAQDRKTIYATLRAIEIVGEATKSVPEHVRDRFPEIPWREMARMRDRVIHAYFGVNPEVVWDTLTDDIPKAVPAMRSCLETLQAEENEAQSSR